ncbi:CMRF35-like molecule 3 [Megalops cyprinoides]|uniref:CMRF35-like molecule 3 n=1 Tax=Megalops cyprinoides TaxID=118141 RepID=UPI001864854F|nr:CMRF35-like molecule 3 [Megalops cyprinoides]
MRTVSRLSVQMGGSVTIPCLYDQEYIYHVKYWCSGGDWNICKTLVRTDSPRIAGDVLIIDSPAQKVFTVTMRNLQEGDSGYYWCGVDIRGGADYGAYLYLTITRGSPGLSVLNNTVVGEEGGSVSIQCLYSDSLRDSVKMWCRIWDWSSCLTAGGTGISQHASVLVSDDRRGVLTVTVRRLERKDTGWYWCTAGEEQFPVHITVTPPKPPTQRPTTMTTTSFRTRRLGSPELLTTALIPNRSGENNPKSSVILEVLLKSAVALVYTTCTTIAMLKIWIYCKQRRAGALGRYRRRKRWKEECTDAVMET